MERRGFLKMLVIGAGSAALTATLPMSALFPPAELPVLAQYVDYCNFTEMAMPSPELETWEYLAYMQKLAEETTGRCEIIN